MSTTPPKKTNSFGLDSLKNLLFDETADPKQPQTAPPPTAAPSGFPAQPSVYPSAPSTYPVPSSVVPPDPAVLARLEGMLKEALPAPYQAFQTQDETLRPIITDDATRFKAALATSKCTKADLIQAIDKGLAAMDGAAQQFQRGVEEKRSRLQASLQNETGQAEEAMRAKNNQIAALQNEVRGLEESIRTSQAKFQEDGQHLDTVRKGFEAAHAQIVQRLTRQRAQMPEGG